MINSIDLYYERVVADCMRAPAIYSDRNNKKMEKIKFSVEMRWNHAKMRRFNIYSMVFFLNGNIFCDH